MDTKYNEQSIRCRIQQLIEGDISSITDIIGKEYLKYRKQQDVSERRCVKELYTPTGIQYLIKFFNESYDLSVCIDNSYSNYDSYLVYTYYNNPILNEKTTSIFLQDVTTIFDKYIVIHSLVSPYSNNKNGQRALKAFLNLFHGIPIIIQAGFLFSGDHDYYYDTSSFDYVDNLVKMYEGLGFVNVNDKIGQYEESVIMINMNGCGPEEILNYNNRVFGSAVLSSMNVFNNPQENS